MRIARNIIRRINEQTCDRYNARIAELGPNPRGLGWLRASYQKQRFSELTRHIDFSHQSIIDIGCGFGDLASYLTDSGIEFRKYLGIDINPRIIEIAQNRHPDMSFLTEDVLLKRLGRKADIVTLIGVINHRLRIADNYVYAEKLMEAAFALARKCLVINALSNYLARRVPVNPAVFHYSPERIFKMCQKITPYVALIQDSLPMPQNEFFLIMKRKPCGK